MDQARYYIAGLEFSDEGYLHIELDQKLEIVFATLEKINTSAMEMGNDVIILVVLHEYFFTPKSISNSVRKKCLQAISEKIKEYPNMVFIPGSFSNFKNEPDSKLSPEKLEKEIKSVKKAYQIANSDERYHDTYNLNNVLFALNYFNSILLAKDNFKAAIFLTNCAYAISSVRKIKHYKQHPFYENSRLPFFNNYVYTFKNKELIQNITVKGTELSILMTVCRDHYFVNQKCIGSKNPDIHVIIANSVDIITDHLLASKFSIHMDKQSGLNVFVNQGGYDISKIKAMLYSIDPNNPKTEVITEAAILGHIRDNTDTDSITYEELIHKGDLIIDESKHAALYESVSSGFFNISKILLEQGANADTLVDRCGNTALCRACDLGDDEHINLLLKNNAYVLHRNKLGQTPLWFAVRSGSLKAVETLINAGANMNTADKDGNTPLLIAAKTNHLKIMDYLLSKKADTYQSNKDRETLPSIAIENNDVAMLKVLLNHHFDINYIKNSLNLLTYAILEMKTEIAIFLIENNANVNLMENCEASPLYFAAHNNDIKMAQLLLKKDAKINQVLPNGETALTIAVDNGYLEMTTYLISNKADITQPDCDGLPPLFIAASKGNIKMTELLLAHCPPLTMEITAAQLKKFMGNSKEAQLQMNGFLGKKSDFIEITVLEFARLMNQVEIVNFLEERVSSPQNQNFTKGWV